MDSQKIFRDLLVAEVRRRLINESLPRVKKCLNELTEAEIWHKPNEHSNSVGNLILHLLGNVRQWVLSGLGGQPDHRTRSLEFSEKGPVPAGELMGRLDDLMAEVEDVLDKLTPGELLQPVQVQGYQETGLSILVHVVEHFSYHTGQITYYVKWKNNMDMGYYEGEDLNVTGNN